MDITEFLRLRSIGLPAIVAGAQASIGLQPDDLLLAVGSLAEGLGNSKSDLDLILVSPRDVLMLPAHDVALVVGTCLFDIQVLQRRKLDAVLARFASWAARPWDITRIADINLDDRRLLHRLRHCSVVFAGEASDLAMLQPGQPDLARLKLQIARHTSRTIQVDMAGNLEAEDYASLVLASQDLLGHAADALLAGHHLTNPTAKWRSRLLQGLPANWETALGTRPTGSNAAHLFWSLHRAPERPERGSAMWHALRITTFARAVFAWAERKLLGATAPARPRAGFPRIDRTHGDICLPHLNLDVDFAAHDGRVILGRLNEFGEPLDLTPHEFEIALLFDGATTAREAELAVRGAYAGDATQRLVDRVMVRVAAAGFSVAPEVM
ncbi:MAG: hypothetical protein JWQ94_4121 [Tardiphaga sp.]|nr:hypothetical protein [Tardiphaga sp.]